jgi:hypothetical protein
MLGLSWSRVLLRLINVWCRCFQTVGIRSQAICYLTQFFSVAFIKTSEWYELLLWPGTLEWEQRCEFANLVFILFVLSCSEAPRYRVLFRSVHSNRFFQTVWSSVAYVAIVIWWHWNVIRKNIHRKVNVIHTEWQSSVFGICNLKSLLALWSPWLRFTANDPSPVPFWAYAECWSPFLKRTHRLLWFSW